MPQSLQTRFEIIRGYDVPESKANQLVTSRATSSFALLALKDAPAGAGPYIANVILGPLSAMLNEGNLGIAQSKILPEQIKALSMRVLDGTVSNTASTSVILPELWAGKSDVDQIISEKGLKQISDGGAIEKIVAEVLAANAQQVADYKAGKEKAFNSLVGQVMKATKGKANPQQVNDILKLKLAG